MKQIYPCFVRLLDGSPRPFQLTDDFIFRTPIMGYMVRSDFYSLDPDGRLRIFTGYCWDLGTMAIDDPAMVVASLEHDAFCDMCNVGELDYGLRPRIDTHFRKRLQDRSRSWVGKSWAWTRYTGVVLYRKLNITRHIGFISHRKLNFWD